MRMVPSLELVPGGENSMTRGTYAAAVQEKKKRQQNVESVTRIDYAVRNSRPEYPAGRRKAE